MYVRYTADLDDRVYSGSDISVFRRLEGARYYKKRLYIYPSDPPEKVWLWSAGYEQAEPDKDVRNRILPSRCIVHYCTKGRGYFNGQPVSAGMVFVAWSNTIHSITADPEDPFCFYWLLVRGEDVSSYIREFSFQADNPIFACDYIGEIVPLFEHLLNADYTKISLPLYSGAMMQAILSYQLSQSARSDREVSVFRNSGYADYINSVKNILYDNNYSMSVDQIAHMLGVTPQHLIRIFQKTLGESPKRYITRKRLGLGKRLLEKGVPPTETANILKYADYPSFYRAFRKEFGINPSKYAKSVVQE